MSIEQEAKEFVEAKEELEPVAVQCSRCSKWSGYNIRNNTKTPIGWLEIDNRYFCGECKTKRK